MGGGGGGSAVPYTPLSPRKYKTPPPTPVGSVIAEQCHHTLTLSLSLSLSVLLDDGRGLVVISFIVIPHAFITLVRGEMEGGSTHQEGRGRSQ